MALEIEQDQDQSQPKRRIPTPDEVFGTKKRIPTHSSGWFQNFQ